MNTSTALEKLYSLQRFGIKLGLQKILKILKYLGNPQKNYPSFHVAGSNGKGSTASFLASIMKEAGNITGLYTSPHFVRFNERIKIDGNEIPDDYISDFIAGMEVMIGKIQPTFFEVTTAMAFKYFSDMKTDWAVIETGLGGRLDATNVLKPIACIFTSISLEHTNILGNNLSSIAEEKAGIIKRGSKIFIGMINSRVIPVFIQKASQNKSPVFLLRNEAKFKREFTEISEMRLKIPHEVIPLEGLHQQWNSALAALTVSRCLSSVSGEVIIKGIENTVGNTAIQGRYEKFSLKPLVIFDSAHNPEGIRSFIRTFRSIEEKYHRRVLIFTAMKDKSIRTMLRLLKPHFTEFRITTLTAERAAGPEFLSEESKKAGIVTVAEGNPADFISEFVKNRANVSDCLAVLGSMYLLGKVKNELELKKT